MRIFHHCLLRRFALLLATASLLTTRAQAACKSDWESTFGADNTATYIVGPRARVVVLAPGRERDAGEAAEAVARALQSGKMTHSVEVLLSPEPTSDLGDVAALHEAHKVAVTADLFIVVRTYPGDSPSSQLALVVFYDPLGDVTASFVAHRGQPLPPRSEATLEPAMRRRAAWASYRALYINQATEGPSLIAWFPVYTEIKYAMRGSSMRWVHPIDLYRQIGHPDLTERVQKRRRVKVGLVAGGFGASTVATIAAAIALPVLFQNRDFSGSQTTMAVLFPTAFVGSVLGTVGLELHPDPIDVETRRQVIGDYNRGLLLKLGLPPEGGESPAPQPLGPLSIDLAPMPVQSGAGLALLLRY